MAEYGNSTGTNRKLKVTGFADRYGGDDYNNNLKLKRANAVKDFLIELGYGPEDIEIKAGDINSLEHKDQFLNRRAVVGEGR